MAIDPREFRRALAQFATGVTVVTTRDAAGEPHGLTVNAFCSVSLEPPLVLVCIDNRSDAHAGFRDSGLFAVSILGEEQQSVSDRFAYGGDAKFTGFGLLAGEHGVPLVPGALAHLECRVRADHAGGDHRIYVGEVLRLHVSPGRPLLYHASDYAGLSGGAEAPDRV